MRCSLFIKKTPSDPNVVGLEECWLVGDTHPVRLQVFSISVYLVRTQQKIENSYTIVPAPLGIEPQYH